MELATFLAVVHFNDGARALEYVLKELGIVPGAQLIAGMPVLSLISAN